MKLRDYQEECLKSISSKWHENINRQLVALPTGSGKTVIFAHLIEQLADKKALVFAHTHELIQQAVEKIQARFPSKKVGQFTGHKKELGADILVSSIQSGWRAKGLELLAKQNFELLVVDEAHHFASNKSRSVLKSLGFDGSDKKKLLVGFTATPYRTDGLGLGEVFDEIVYHKTIKDLVTLGYLCEPKGLLVSTDIDLSKVAIDRVTHDFKIVSLAEIMDTPEINNILVESYREKALGRQAVCFSVNVQHAKNLSEAFNSHGVSSRFVSGETPFEERSAIIKSYREGGLQVLCNCQVLTEGFDAPETSCIIVARPTQSPSLYQQMIGRGLRISPSKKDCLVLDFGDNDHSICHAGMLLKDSEDVAVLDKTISVEQRKKEALEIKFTKDINKWFVEKDILGVKVRWTVMKNGNRFLRTSSYSRKSKYDDGNFWLWIFRPTTKKKWFVLLMSDNTMEQRLVAWGYDLEKSQEIANRIIDSLPGVFNPREEHVEPLNEWDYPKVRHMEGKGYYFASLLNKKSLDNLYRADCRSHILRNFRTMGMHDYTPDVDLSINKAIEWMKVRWCSLGGAYR